ncbi:trypsin-like peptidase domain-containing protein [Streptomyces sp. NPDC086080]|uniref:trypsin-like peptidase domain-containing protein n=1 Tax=Streptomyces sp. NPDC086080 TaxID=3365748 RepID=UPI0037CDF02B
MPATGPAPGNPEGPAAAAPVAEFAGSEAGGSGGSSAVVSGGAGSGGPAEPAASAPGGRVPVPAPGRPEGPAAAAPVVVPAGSEAEGSVGSSVVVSGGAGSGGPAAPVASATGVHDPGGPAAEGIVPGAPVAAAPAVGEQRRPGVAGAGEVAGQGDEAGSGWARPLHDPDPYSTPPYGEPGPWAPAPPVQHPAGTPAHGVMAAVPAPAGAGHPADAPGHGAAESPASPPVADTAPAVPAQGHPGPTTQSPPADPWGRYDPWAAAAAGAPLQRAEPVLMDREQRRRRARRAIVGGALLLALVSGGVGGIVGGYLERNGGLGTVELPQAAEEDAARDPDSIAGIAAQALPSVVTLHVSGGGAAGTGTGFVLDERGHILTNDHVVGPAGDDGEITVTFHSGDTAEATVVGRDSGYDLAVVKVKGVRGLAPLPLGNSDNVRVGDPVVAIGAPFDLAGTVTAGIISARERPITAGGENGDGTDVSYVDALQTDAPINPGNSGGPLLDAQGRVIGINSAIRSAGGADPDGGQAGSIGLGFAIPVNQGKRVAEELINTGKATHPVIGITLDMDYGGDGARVAAKGHDGGPPVSTGGPGARAGIKAGDVITEVDGRRVHSGEELIVKTRAHRPGDRLELTLERDGEERKVSLVLGSSDGG